MKRARLHSLIYSVLCLVCIQCNETKNTKNSSAVTTDINSISQNIKKEKEPLLEQQPDDIETPKGMVWITGATYSQGAVPQDKLAMWDEKPAHKVTVDGFFMTTTEVTNSQFKAFVDATKYVTIAERTIKWEEMKKQLPANTPKPHDSILQPGSLTFKKTKSTVENLYDFSQWWRWTIGANWQHPNGPNSSIKGKDNEPVVHIAYEDALAYCKWTGTRLPTEAEWELAARGNVKDAIYSWGDDASELDKRLNSWGGEFPVTNNTLDGFEQRAPVASYAPNDFGLYDMAGNVWEWTSDWYNTKYYKILKNKVEIVRNPSGAEEPYDAQEPYARKKVIKSGSFLCNASYCASYRVSARMNTSIDSSSEHVGFRTVTTVEMLRNQSNK